MGEAPQESSPDPRVAVLQSPTADPAAQEQAFTEIVEDFQGELTGYAQGLVGPNDAEDIVQGAFFNAYRSMDRFDNQDRQGLRSWLYKITLNMVRNVKRHESKGALGHAATQGLEPDAASSLASRIGIPDAELEFKEDLAVLDKINERQRFAMIKVAEGYSHDDIARMLDTTISGVKSLLTRGRTRGIDLLHESETYERPDQEAHEAA